jgi:urease accessory protein
VSSQLPPAASAAAKPATSSSASSTGGWHATLSLGYQRRGGRTVLAERHRHGPLTVQRSFYPEGAVCHNYLLHPPGGVVGGDRLDISVNVAPGAHALITTPGATKLYRSAGPLAMLQQTLRVQPQATLEWLPQENILFPGANVALQTRVELQPGSRFIGWEMHCLGRPVINERFDSGHALLGLALLRAQRPLLLERLRVHGQQGLNGPAGLRGHPISATLLATPANKADLALCQQLLAAQPDSNIAATLIDDLLIVRHLGNDSAHAAKLLRQLWEILRQPLLGIAPCRPRIWAT